MDIAYKTIGVLIDELFTTDHKLWDAQDLVMSTDDMELAGRTSVKIHQLNARRTELILAINKRFGESNFGPTEKNYA